ncbi:MAG: phosphopentomutase, partial [Pseudomonadota bacterium]
MRRAIIIVLDSFGIGATPDAYRFGDAGSNTLGAIATACETACAQGQREHGLRLPNLTRLGLVHAAQLAAGQIPAGMSLPRQTAAAWGCAREHSSGKDTPSGHWEMAGLPVLFDWGYFANKKASFPPAFLDALVTRTGLPGVLGDCHASGTVIL